MSGRAAASRTRDRLRAGEHDRGGEHAHRGAPLVQLDAQPGGGPVGRTARCHPTRSPAARSAGGRRPGGRRASTRRRAGRARRRARGQPLRRMTGRRTAAASLATCAARAAPRMRAAARFARSTLARARRSSAVKRSGSPVRRAASTAASASCSAVACSRTQRRPPCNRTRIAPAVVSSATASCARGPVPVERGGKRQLRVARRVLAGQLRERNDHGIGAQLRRAARRFAHGFGREGGPHVAADRAALVGALVLVGFVRGQLLAPRHPDALVKDAARGALAQPRRAALRGGRRPPVAAGDAVHGVRGGVVALRIGRAGDRCGGVVAADEQLLGRERVCVRARSIRRAGGRRARPLPASLARRAGARSARPRRQARSCASRRAPRRAAPRCASRAAARSMRRSRLRAARPAVRVRCSSVRSSVPPGDTLVVRRAVARAQGQYRHPLPALQVAG